MFKWVEGRQKSGYDKICLVLGSFFDVHLLRFKVGAEIAPHVDTVTSGRHFRLNIIYRKANEGGLFKCENMIFETDRIKLFRPDIETHSVSEVKFGVRRVLSIGWVLNESKK